MPEWKMPCFVLPKPARVWTRDHLRQSRLTHFHTIYQRYMHYWTNRNKIPNIKLQESCIWLHSVLPKTLLFASRESWRGISDDQDVLIFILLSPTIYFLIWIGYCYCTKKAQILLRHCSRLVPLNSPKKNRVRIAKAPSRATARTMS